MRLREAENGLLETLGSEIAPRPRFRMGMRVPTKANLAKRDAYLRSEFVRRHAGNDLAAKGKSDTKQIRELQKQLETLKQEKQADAQLIQNLVDANKEHAAEMEKQQLIKQEVDTRNAQLVADQEPLQFEITRMRERNTNLQRELTTVRSQNHQLRTQSVPDHPSAMDCMRTQNVLMKNRIRALTAEHKSAQTKHAQEIDTLKKQISNLQCQIRTSVLNWQVDLRRKHPVASSRTSHQRSRDSRGASGNVSTNRVHWQDLVSSRPRRPLNGIDYVRSQSRRR